MKSGWALAVAWVLAGGCGSAVAAERLPCPTPLRIAFNDVASPPVIHGQGPAFADPPGWQVESVRDALRRLGCAGDLQRLPSRRMSASLKAGQIDFAMLYAATPERLKTYVFPLDSQGRPDPAWAPAFAGLVLFARPGTPPRPAAWDGRTLPAGWTVGAVAGSVHEDLVRDRAWALDAFPSVDHGAQMLLHGRFELLLASRESLSLEVRDQVVEWGVVARQPFFAPASPKFAAQHPEWTRAFWQELCRATRRQEPDARPVDCGATPPLTPFLTAR